MRNWRTRLTPVQRRIYDRSTSIGAISFVEPPQLPRAISALAGALTTADQAAVQAVAQIIANAICRALNVRTIRVRVHGIRPSNRRGEVHGLYTQLPGDRRSDTIQVWMRTAKRGQVVAFRTFLRTLLHEVCHHLDYTHFRLAESYHTEGFFQRESSLFRILVQPSGKPTVRPRPALSDMVRDLLTARKRPVQRPDPHT